MTLSFPNPSVRLERKNVISMRKVFGRTLGSKFKKKTGTNFVFLVAFLIVPVNSNTFSGHQWKAGVVGFGESIFSAKTLSEADLSPVVFRITHSAGRGWPCQVSWVGWNRERKFPSPIAP